MRVSLIGYGKMGKIIEKISQSRGHEVVARIDETPRKEILNNPDVVIEFSSPESAYDNIKICLDIGIPVVCGTTGWLDKKSEIEKYTVEKNGTFLYGSNFSLGVNLFFTLNKKLAKLMNPFQEYIPQLEEIHHVHKKDIPSGTAITLAEGIIENSNFDVWKLDKTSENKLGISALRKDEVPGTHSVFYKSNVDEIEIKHTAFTRDGFALGAVIAAEWIVDKKGVFSMDDVLGFTSN